MINLPTGSLYMDGLGFSAASTTMPSAVQRLSIASGMDTPAMKEMLSSGSEPASSIPPVAVYDAKAQTLEPAKGTPSKMIDIMV